ncbi:MAG TPA: hypothetical protein DCQ98_06825 [Planctomycetaceae bacterium]|nr:hypothetical protein [Planctomycetaceae bacterium]
MKEGEGLSDRAGKSAGSADGEYTETASPLPCRDADPHPVFARRQCRFTSARTAAPTALFEIAPPARRSEPRPPASTVQEMRTTREAFSPASRVASPLGIIRLPVPLRARRRMYRSGRDGNLR